MAAGPEFAWWEADFVHDVTVRGNRVQSSAAGIYVGACRLDADEAPVEQRLNRNISISGNLICSSRQTPIVATSASGLAITDNTIRNALPRAGTRGHGWEVEGKLLLVMHAAQLTLRGNAFQADCPEGSAADYSSPIELVDVEDGDTCSAECLATS